MDYEAKFAEVNISEISQAWSHTFLNLRHNSEHVDLAMSGTGRSHSPGQTDQQVVASRRNLNLRRDLRWVAKRTRKFPRKYRQVAKKKNILR